MREVGCSTGVFVPSCVEVHRNKEPSKWTLPLGLEVGGVEDIQDLLDCENGLTN